MALQQTFLQTGDVFNTAMPDPVFEPDPDFNFEEEPNHMMQNTYPSQLTGDFPL